MKYIQLAWSWLVYSSTNSAKLSASIKGAIATVLVVVSTLAGDVNISLLGDNVNQIIDGALAGVQALVGLVSSVYMVFGLVRKIVTTLKGTNAVIAAPTE